MFAQQLVNGLMLGGAYALVAIGYTLIFGVLNLLHLAHGEVFMVGAYVGLALALAERGRGHTSPNPMVGALIVSPEGVIVGTGYHERAGGLGRGSAARPYGQSGRPVRPAVSGCPVIRFAFWIA